MAGRSQDFDSAVNLAHLPFTGNIPYNKTEVWWSMWDRQVTSHQQGMLYTQMLKNIKSCLWLDSVTENPECRRALKAENRVCTIQCLRFFCTQRPWRLQSDSWLFDPPISDSAMTSILWAQLYSLHTTSTCCRPWSLLDRAHQPHPMGIMSQTDDQVWGFLCSLSKQLTYLKVLSNGQSNSSEHLLTGKSTELFSSSKSWWKCIWQTDLD